MPDDANKYGGRDSWDDYDNGNTMRHRTRQSALGIARPPERYIDQKQYNAAHPEFGGIGKERAI